MRSTLARSLPPVLLLAVLARPAAAGVDRWTSLGPEGGWILSLAADPGSPGTLYAGTLSGDVWKSLDGGGHWAPTPDGLGLDWIKDLAVSRGRVFAATSYGISVLTEGAAAWRDTGPPWREEAQCLAVDPTNPDRLWAGTLAGHVLASEDGGAHWAEKLDLFPSIDSIAVAPTAPPTVYAAGQFGVFKSVNGGSSWSQIVRGDLPGRGPHGGAALRVDPVDASTLYLLADDRVWKTTDAGRTWAALSPSFDVPGSLLVLPGSLLAGTDQGLMRSEDGGSTWQRQLPRELIPIAMAADPFAPGGAWISAGDQGVFRSADSGRTWAVSRRGLTASDVSTLVFDPFRPRTLYVASTGPRLHWSGNAGASWHPLPLQDVSSLAADPQHPGTLYATAENLAGNGVWVSLDRGAHWRLILKAPAGQSFGAMAVDPAHPGTIFVGGLDLRRSRDGGRTWTILPRLQDERQSTTTLLFSPWHPGTLYRFESLNLGRSTDSGDTWELILPGGQGIAALAFDSRTPDLLYAADANFGGIWRSRDGGSTWEALAPYPGDHGVVVTALLVDRLDPATLYLGSQGDGLWRSRDGGVTWEPFSPGVHAPYITCLAADPRDPHRLLACTRGAGLLEIRVSG
jgi:photosystem II stability/assembly factor-like uncharacterized protein